jgi:DNA polymerase-3 subunit alpha
LRGALAAFRDGDLPVRLRYRRPGALGELALGDTWRVEPSDALLKRLRQVLGRDAVAVVYAHSPLAGAPHTAQPPRSAAA